MNKNFFKRYIRVVGDSYHRGYSIGNELKDRIHINYLNQVRYFKETYGYDLVEWEKESPRFISSMEEYAHETLNEIKGMADGADIPLNKLVSLICGFEKLMRFSTEGSRCTAFAATKSATPNGGTICGQNNDERIDEWLPQLDVLIHHIDGERETLMYTHPGIPGHMGMNNRGIGLLLTYIDNGERREGVPSYVIPNEILNKDSFEEAVEYVLSIPHEVPNEFIISDRNGRIASIECFPNKKYIDYGETKDYVVHANHNIIGTEENEKTTSWSTIKRLETMDKLISENFGKIDFDVCKKILSSHENYPASICVHPNVNGVNNQTRPSMIFDLESGDFNVAFGCPCECDYEKYKFDKYLQANND